MLTDFPHRTRMANLPRPLTLARELEVFEGAILSELRAAEGGGIYIEKWCTRHENIDRTLVVRSEQRAIAEYLSGRMTMLSLLSGPSDGVGFIVDRSDGVVFSVYPVSLEELPPKYLPSPTAKHDESLRPHWTTVPQNFLIGTDWDARLLARIERKYLDLSGFVLLTEPGTPQKLPDSIFGIEYDGGFPVMHMFNSIRAAIPRASRPRSVGVSANSPGVLTIDAPGEIVSLLMKAINALPGSHGAYESLHTWSRLHWKKAESVPGTADFDIKRLADRLGVDSAKLFPAAGIGEGSEKIRLLMAAKILAAFYRALWSLLEPERGVEFISAPRQDDPEEPPFDDDDDDDGFDF